MSTGDRFMTTTEAAALTGKTALAVRRLAREHKVPGAVKIGRDWLIPESSIATIRDLPGRGRWQRRTERMDGPKFTHDQGGCRAELVKVSRGITAGETTGPTATIEDWPLYRCPVHSDYSVFIGESTGERHPSLSD